MNSTVNNRLQNRRFAVLGAGISGMAAAELLKIHNAEVVMADQGDPAKRPEAVQRLEELSIPAYWGETVNDALTNADIIVLSPGISRANACVSDAVAAGKTVIAEVELASWFVRPNDKLIGITGTNGKTTTTAWTAHILREAGKTVCCGGNIGDAWSALIPKLPETPVIHVIELSSYQLESIESMKPDIAMNTNVTPDHLERYGTMEAYAAAKRRIFMNMSDGDFYLINAASKPDYVLSDRANDSFTLCRIGTDDSCDTGIDARGMMFVKVHGNCETLLAADDLPIPGMHNVENALFAALAARLAGASLESVIRGLKTFLAVEHRIELCGEWNGIRFYNDSKATNVDSLEKALVSFPTRKVVLIAGGVHKKAPYTPLCDLVTRGVRAVVTIGEAAPIIEDDWKDCGVPMQRAQSMREAVETAMKLAVSGDVIMLSPACASFDWYPMPGGGFEARGRDFKTIVAELTAAR